MSSSAVFTTVSSAYEVLSLINPECPSHLSQEEVERVSGMKQDFVELLDLLGREKIIRISKLHVEMNTLLGVYELSEDEHQRVYYETSELERAQKIVDLKKEIADLFRVMGRDKFRKMASLRSEINAIQGNHTDPVRPKRQQEQIHESSVSSDEEDLKRIRQK